MWRREPRMEERSEEGKRKLRELGILRREIRSRLFRKDLRNVFCASKTGLSMKRVLYSKEGKSKRHS
jgi:hypothetical protein